MSTQTSSLYSEVSDSYLLYACSIFNRALPNVVDGLKTAQRRIILGLNDLNLRSDGPFKKVSRLEGHTLGCYHPNGGCAGTAINMGQCNTFRYPLTNIHGNVGGSIQVGSRVGQSLDESPPAAARYLEIKSTTLTDEVFLKECDKHISTWIPNYDGSTEEITHFVPSLPTLLVNGSTGIAVGFASNHVPYNALEVINATQALLENPNLSIADLRKYVSAPDFPHYPRVLDKNIDLVLETGSGTLELYGEWEFVEVPYKKKSKRSAIKVTSLASGNSEKFVDQIYKAVAEEKIDTIAEVSNLSSRHGLEIMIILKANTDPSVVLSQLLKYTCLFDTIGVNATGLLPNESIPRKFGFREIVKHWYEFRASGLVSRFKASLLACQHRLEILDGLIVVVNNIDRVIEIVKTSESIAKAAELLKSEFQLTDLQAKAILDISLKSLVKTEVAKLLTEKKKVSAEASLLTKRINSPAEVKKYIIRELESLKSIFAEDKRRTKLTQSIEQSPPAVAQQLCEFKTSEGRKLRKEKLEALKAWARQNGLPSKGKRGWNAFMHNKELTPYVKIEKEIKKWISS